VRKLHSIFWLPGDYSLVPAGSIVTVPHDPGVNDPLAGIDGAFLADRGLKAIVQLPITSNELLNAGLFRLRVEALRDTLRRKRIVPWAISVGDEAFDSINNGWLSWPCFGGFRRPSEDMLDRKTWAYPRIKALYAEVTRAFPAVPTMQVETRINEDRSNVGLWYPDCGADILAIDAYLWADGCPWLKTEPLTATTGPDPKFGREVAWMCVGTPPGFVPRLTGAFASKKPVVLIAPTFHDLSGTWRTLPTNKQIRWYYEWGVSQPQVIGLGFYAVQSVPGQSVGLDRLPETYAGVRQMLAEMSGGEPVADPVPVGAVVVPAPSTPGPAPTATTICTIAVKDNKTLVITSADGRVQTVAV
jgi:hypothetical protein